MVHCPSIPHRSQLGSRSKRRSWHASTGASSLARTGPCRPKAIATFGPSSLSSPSTIPCAASLYSLSPAPHFFSPRPTANDKRLFPRASTVPNRTTTVQQKTHSPQHIPYLDAFARHPQSTHPDLCCNAFEAAPALPSPIHPRFSHHCPTTQHSFTTVQLHPSVPQQQPPASMDSVPPHTAASFPNQRPVVHLLYGNGGGGHKASAYAVEVALSRLQSPPRVCLINASAVVGAKFGDDIYNFLLALGATSLVSALHTLVAIFLPIASPRMRAAFSRLWFTPASTRPSHGSTIPSDSNSRPPPPDLVVSFVPQLNAVMAEALQPYNVPLITVLTDFTHTSDHPWIQHPDQHVVCGTERAFKQCADILPTAHRTQTSGMVVHPRFYDISLTAEQIWNTRRGLGLDPSLMTVLLLFGANPPTKLVKHLVSCYLARSSASPVNLVVICGKNNTLRREITASIVKSGAASVTRDAAVPDDLFVCSDEMSSLTSSIHQSHERTESSKCLHTGFDETPGTGDLFEKISSTSGDSLKGTSTGNQDTSNCTPVEKTGLLSASRNQCSKEWQAARVFVTGFTREVALFMRIADVLVGKPGPGVVSEAFVSRLPCVLLVGERGQDVMTQEKDVVDWVVSTGVGIAVRNPIEAASVTNDQVARMREAIDRQPCNNAVFEVASLIGESLFPPAVDSCSESESSSFARPFDTPHCSNAGSRMVQSPSAGACSDSFQVL